MRQNDVSSPSVNEKVKVTNSNGELLIHIDGATSGITTVGISTSGESFRFDSNQNVTFFGSVTGTGLDVNGNADISGNLNVGGVLTYEDVTNIDSVGVVTARSGLQVTGGNVAIGHNSPTYMLHLKQYGNNEIVLNNTRGSSTGGFAAYDDHIEVSAVTNDPLLLKTNNIERLRIDSSGNVSIHSGAYGGGGTAPQLYVRGTGGRQVKIHNSNAGTSSLQITNGTTGEGEDAGTQLYTQGTTGDFFIYNSFATGDVAFSTRPSGGSTTERLRITSAGQLLLGINNAVDAEVDFQIHSATSGNGPILNMTNDTEVPYILWTG